MNSKYTVEKRDGCTIVYGAVPLSDMGKLMTNASPGDVLDTSLSSLLGATMAFGNKEDTKKLTNKVREEKINQLNDEDFVGEMDKKHPGFAKLSLDSQKWFIAGEFGLSAAAIFSNTVIPHPYIKNERKNDQGFYENYPRDVDDFTRCLSLLSQSPEASGRFKNTMKKASSVWNELVSKWDELHNSLEEEIPHWKYKEGGSAPKTNKMINSIIESTQQNTHKTKGFKP